MFFIGDVEVRYQAKSASLSSLGPGETLATAGSDFDDTIMTIIIEDEVGSKTFIAPIIDVSLAFKYSVNYMYIIRIS